MLKVSIIGIGNAGSQVAEKAAQMSICPAMAINSSEKDLSQVSDKVLKFMISDKEGFSQGAGKNRSLAKKYLKDSIIKLLSTESVKNFISSNDVVFIVSSSAGGTGSGTAPLMCSILSSTFVDTKFIMVGITPVYNETLSSQVNTLDYLNELYTVLNNQTYMLYDNDKYSSLPSYQMMDAVNTEIIRDIEVIRCTHNIPTPYESIDEEDMSRLISFPGMLNVVRVEGIREKELDNASIEDMIISKLKKNGHVDFQRDKIVAATGIIVNLDEGCVSESFDTHIPKVFDFIGTPDHDFSHFYVYPSSEHGSNNAYLIMSGLNPVNDKMNSIINRIEEIKSKQKVKAPVDSDLGGNGLAINNINLADLNADIASKDTRNAEKNIETNLSDIFDMFKI